MPRMAAIGREEKHHQKNKQGRKKKVSYLEGGVPLSASNLYHQNTCLKGLIAGIRVQFLTGANTVAGFGLIS